MQDVVARTIALAGTIAVTLAVGAADSRSASGGPIATARVSQPRPAATTGIDGNVTIRGRLTSGTNGTFSITGAITDSGTLRAARRVARGRMQLTQTLTGNAGVIRILATRSCRAASGTWVVLSGSSAYAGLTGGGAARGGPRCAAPRYPALATYTGSVRTPPPPPLAQPGNYGGGTAQRQEVRFTVSEGGRSVSSLRMLVSTQCQGTSFTSGAPIFLQGPFDIASDGTFTLRLTPAFEGGSVTGRFTSLTAAEGTATVQTSITVSGGGTHECAGTTTWKASLPPPAATPGRYCGFTNQGPSVCLDVDPTGRIVTRIEVGVVVLCNGRTTEVELRLVFTDMPVGGNLGFSESSSTLEGLISGTAAVSGLLDPDGGTGAHGSVRVQLPVFDLEGSRYSCGVASALWEARRQ
jgi:hypothetical protein